MDALGVMVLIVVLITLVSTITILWIMYTIYKKISPFMNKLKKFSGGPKIDEENLLPIEVDLSKYDLEGNEFDDLEESK